MKSLEELAADAEARIQEHADAADLVITRMKEMSDYFASDSPAGPRDNSFNDLRRLKREADYALDNARLRAELAIALVRAINQWAS